MNPASDGNRLLIVSAHFPPDRSAGTHRVVRLANYLQSHGWDTSVLTIDPACYRHSIQQDESLVKRTDPRVSIVRTSALRGHTAMVRWRNRLLGRAAQPRVGTVARDAPAQGKTRKTWRRTATTNLFGFPDDEIGWLGPAVARGLQVIRRRHIDVVLSSAPPFTCHLIGHALRSMCNVRWVADFRDPWSRAPWGKAGSARAHRWLESQVVTRADAVVLNTSELHREFAEWYGSDVATRFHVVANGYDAGILEPFAKASPAEPPPLILTHAGNLYGARDPLPLLQGLAKCLHDGAVPHNGIRLNLVGKVSSAFDVGGAITRLGLDGQVTRTQPVSHDESLRMLAASHVLVAIQPGTTLQIPVKLYEYVGLRRTILALAEEGAVARLVRGGGFGLVVSPSDVAGIAAALTDLYRRREMLVQLNIDNARVADFDAGRQSIVLMDILSTLVTRAVPYAPRLAD